MRNFVRAGLAGLFVAFSAAGAFAGPVYEVHVAGLACPFCAYGIEKTLGAIEGVESARTNLEAGVVAVEMADGATLSETQARTAVDKAGFTLEGLEKTGD
jgi:mercuric ion binding protein